MVKSNPCRAEQTLSQVALQVISKQTYTTYLGSHRELLRHMWTASEQRQRQGLTAQEAPQGHKTHLFAVIRRLPKTGHQVHREELVNADEKNAQCESVHCCHDGSQSRPKSVPANRLGHLSAGSLLSNDLLLRVDGYGHPP